MTEVARIGLPIGRVARILRRNNRGEPVAPHQLSHLLPAPIALGQREAPVGLLGLMPVRHVSSLNYAGDDSPIIQRRPESRVGETLSGVVRCFAFLLSFCVFVSAVSSAPAAEAPAGGKSVVKLGIVGRPDMAAYVLAIRRGYFDKQGIAIERVTATSGQEFPAQLATDQLQVASGVPNAALFNALNRGIDIRIVADEAHIGNAEDRTGTIVARAALG